MPRLMGGTFAYRRITSLGEIMNMDNIHPTTAIVTDHERRTRYRVVLIDRETTKQEESK